MLALFICTLLVPVIILIIGLIFSKVQVKDINSLIGYRTPMSVKNQETWDFANRYFPKVWIVMSIGMLGITLLCWLILIKQSVAVAEKTATAITLVQTALLFLSIIPCEIALKKNFDKDGNRIK
jgi:uncharacterized membrane protein